jgi:seryl-tRNA synthetase
MGRPKTKDFTPQKFQKLSTEERQIRGRMSTLNRMIKSRKDKINELLKPINKLESEIDGIESELIELKNKIHNMGFDFPKFRIESFNFKTKNSYYRGVWYVNSKKNQLYIGTETTVHTHLCSIHPDFKLLTPENGIKQFKLLIPEDRIELIFKEYESQLQLKYWENQYKVDKG